ncbi:MAG: sulfate permease [Desulfobulbaceae bacterium]|nr:sulfate permease [Desulfobulbaceae bacterium]HIJ78894.1 sulfate permease [Deltaproteobacteria bacterium]
MNTPLVPELVATIRQGYTRKQLLQDLMAGAIVGIVALPLAIAFAIASGVKPEQGLYTAIIAGLIISSLSGSRFQIGGPTGAFIIVVFSIVHDFGYQGLAIATMMAGVIMIAMGLARLGAVIKFIPYPMTVGFTSGIAILIATTQIKAFLGLDFPDKSAHFIARISEYAAHITTYNPWAILISSITLFILIFWPKISKKIPGAIIAILFTTILVQLFKLPVSTIATQFGAVPSVIPMPKLPAVSWETIPHLIAPALTIAMLGSIESLLSAVVADGMTGTRHKSNMELVAQGIANLVTPLFGGIPATGAIARTATNIKNGAQSPVAGIIHAVVLLLILIFLGKWAALIPMPSLAAVLLVVAYHMSEWRHFAKLFQAPKADILVMLATFCLTIFVDLTVAIEAGVVLSALLFMNRMANLTETRNITRELTEDYEREDDLSISGRSVPEGVEVFEIYGPFFFGAANQFKDTMGLITKPPKVLILRMRHVLSIDATAMNALEEVVRKTKNEGTLLIFSGVRPHLHSFLKQNGIGAKMADVQIFANIDLALQEARRHMTTLTP